MIAELGHAALWIAAATALMQLLASYSSLRAPRWGWAGAVRPLAIVQGALAAAAMIALIALFLRTDLSVLNVAANSHSAKPWLYKLAGAWGSHEGSLLLWVAVLAMAGAGVALFERRLAKPALAATLGAQALLALGFYAFLLLSSNPFARLVPAPAEGLGLNPLLQDPGLAFHPPTLYFGYVGLSIAFSFAVGALVTGEIGRDFARAMRPWVLGAWVFLTLGITAGSYWAYYELGWGGWWFWDPVENVSLMPWLAATALLHSVSVTANRDGLRAWTLVLALVAFSLSMVGTFVVRSGLLTSVHSFAVDPERGVFILALLAIYTGGAFALFALRLGRVREGTHFELISREGALVVNNLLLSVILGIVFIGTFYPIIAEAMGSRISVGPPYFNRAAGPVALLLVALLSVGPALRWRRDTLTRIPAWLPGSVIAALAGAGALLIIRPQTGVLPALGLALGIAIAVASLWPLAAGRRRTTALFAMVTAHFGIAVALIGMASESAFSVERLASARAGERLEVGPWQVTLDDVVPTAGENFTAMEGRMTVRYGADNAEAETLAPQIRHYTAPPTETNEAALLGRWNGQLYAVIARGSDTGQWQVRLWWKPFVTLIWLGGILVALGGALALAARAKLPVRLRRLWWRMMP